MKFTNPKGWTGRFTLCPGYSLLNFLDERVFSLNDSDVRLDLDSAGSFFLDDGERRRRTGRHQTQTQQSFDSRLLCRVLSVPISPTFI